MSVIIGMDPHKRSATIEVIDQGGRVLQVGRFDTDQAGYAAMLAAGRGHGVIGERVWAVEGCNGIGRHIAHRLVHDGERVLDVPTFLSAPQARALVAKVKPRDLVGKTRRRLVVELIGELEVIDRKIKTAEKELTALVQERGSTLLELTGIGPT